MAYWNWLNSTVPVPEFRDETHFQLNEIWVAPSDQLAGAVPEADGIMAAGIE
jgi:hypothetical protein